MDQETNKERSYIAFISYRHTSLDREAAERVQKKIENYRVPKEFRDKVGGDRLGMCFRDEDELPASASLSDSIYYALDHTKFLIVICTPNLPLSKWCEAEIRYFLKTHDRDHLLAVLADGDPSEAFSPYMLHDYDEEGNIVRDWEPLAANIAGPNHTIDNKAFKKEIVRLYAALIGCPFDELWQRDRRARTRRLGIAGAAAFAVMAVFLGVVLNRNAQIEERNVQITAQNEQITEQNEQISEQLDQIQEQNEQITEQNTELQKKISTANVDSGINKLADHDITGALEDALAAIESDDPEIYDHRVEKLLVDSLGVYKSGSRLSSAVYEQSSEIVDFKLTDDEHYVLLTDSTGVLRCLDIKDYSVLWDLSTGRSNSFIYTEGLSDRMIYTNQYGAFALNLESGELLWSFEHSSYSENNFSCLSNDGKTLALLEYYSVDSGYETYVLFLDTATGEEKGRTLVNTDGFELLVSSFSGRSRYGAAFSETDSKFVCALRAKYKDEEEQDVNTTLSFLIHTDTFEKENVARADSITMVYGMCCYDENDDVFIASYSQNLGGVYTLLCKKENGEYTYDAKTTSHDMSSSDGGMYYNYDGAGFNYCPMLASDDLLVIFSDNRMLVFDRYENICRNSYALNGKITNAFWFDKEQRALELLSSDSWMLCYILGTGNTVISNIYGYDGDVKDLKKSIPVGGGFISRTDGTWSDNFESGAVLSVSNSAPSKLMLMQAVNDPNLITPDLSYESGHFKSVLFYPECENAVVYAVDYSNNAAFADQVSRTDNSVVKSIRFDQKASYGTAVMTDSDSFVDGNVKYMPDGTIEEFAALVPIDNTTKVQPLYHRLLSDGSILSFNEASYYSINNLYDTHYISANIYPVWLNGSLVESTLEPQNALIAFYDYNNDDYPKYYAGNNGYICVYGRRIICGEKELEIDEEHAFSFLEASTGNIVSVADPHPECVNYKFAMGNRSGMAALAYEDGKIWLIGPDVPSKEISKSFERGEIKAVCFSDDDRYLLIVTSSATLCIYDISADQIVFSEVIDTFSEFIETTDPHMESQTLSGGSKLAFTVRSYDTNTSGYGAIIDTENWLLCGEVYGMVTADPEYNRIYAYRNNTLVSYPVYDIAMLKSLALTALEQ